MTRHACVVLGMHRSGTSALTRVLGLMGAALPRDLMPPTADNARGYWESRRIATLNNRLLASAGTHWSDAAPIPQDWFTDPRREADRDEAAALLDEEFAGEATVALKDPRICRLLPFWRTVLEIAHLEPCAVLVLRDPLEVARSLAARAADPAFRPAAIPDPSRSLLLWLRSVLDAERNSRDLRRHIVDYSDLLADWRTALRPISDAGVLPRASAEAASLIDGFLDPTMRRQDAARLEGDIPLPGLERLRALLLAIKVGGKHAAAACDEVAADLERLDRLHPPARIDDRSPAASDRRALEILTGLEPTRRPATRPQRSILFLSGSPTSIGHVYRVRHPVEALVEHGWRSTWLPVDAPDAATRIGDAHIVTVFRCPWSPAVEVLFDTCRRRRIPVVYDIDDLIFDPALMEAGAFGYLDILPDDERRRWIAAAADYRRALAAADAATLTTAPLAAAAAAHCPRVRVLANAHSPAMFAAAAAARRVEKPSRLDGRVRIGFASGTPTHQRDFALVAPALARLLARRPDPVLTIVGALDLAAFPELEPHAARIELRPLVPLDRLPEEVARFDINLAPLEVGNPFCEAKSPIRCTTAATVGVPTVASPTEPLSDAIVPGETGFLANDVEGWEEAVDCLLGDPEFRSRMGEAAEVRLRERMGWSTWSALADRTYSAILHAHGSPAPN